MANGLQKDQHSFVFTDLNYKPLHWYILHKLLLINLEYKVLKFNLRPVQIWTTFVTFIFYESILIDIH